MNSTFAETDRDAPRSSAPPAALPIQTTLTTLVRREFWEHRALWLCPAVVAGLLAVSGMIAHARFDTDTVAQLAPAEGRIAMFTISQWALAMPLYLAMIIVLSFYAIDCLYAERKDRSILFWKSLPVSDELTVLSKLLVALVVVPLGVFLLAAATGLVFSVIFATREAFGFAPQVLWFEPVAWLKTQAVLLLMMVLSVLWTAPITGYLMLVSAWARRSPLLLATLPVAVAPLLERIVLGTHYLWDFISYRSFGIWRILGVQNSHVISKHGVHEFGTLLTELDWRAAFTSVDLWLGVVATAAMAYAAARIRRYRDDT
jgi:ABC-2 type transport system permease protein